MAGSAEPPLPGVGGVGMMTGRDADSSGLTVAVTGATGELGKPFVRALEQTADVGRVRAMARRPFDPRRLGWRKTDYRQGDILDRGAVEQLVAGADVVAHLAFIVVKASGRSYEINIEGSRNVFGAVAAARVPRLVYTSSLAAYGYHAHEGLLTEDYTDPRNRASRLLPAEGRGGTRPARDPRGLGHSGVRVPALHRGGSEAPASARCDSVSARGACAARLGAAGAATHARTAAGASRSRCAVSARAPRRRRGGARGGRAGAGRAGGSTTWPGPAGPLVRRRP